MPRNSKPRRPYRPRQSIYPDLHDVGLIFRPIHRLFDQLRQGEIDSAKGKPLFLDWQGQWCEVVPALEGWVLSWTRIIEGDGISGQRLDATIKLAKKLDYSVPLTLEDVESAWKEMLSMQRITLKIPRNKIANYMRAEQISIEMERLGIVSERSV